MHLPKQAYNPGMSSRKYSAGRESQNWVPVDFKRQNTP